MQGLHALSCAVRPCRRRVPKVAANRTKLLVFDRGLHKNKHESESIQGAHRHSFTGSARPQSLVAANCHTKRGTAQPVSLTNNVSVQCLADKSFRTKQYSYFRCLEFQRVCDLAT